MCRTFIERSENQSKMFWRNNTTYRVFTDLYRNYAERIFHREPIIGKSGQISREKIDIHLNYLLNYD